LRGGRDSEKESQQERELSARSHNYSHDCSLIAKGTLCYTAEKPASRSLAAQCISQFNRVEIAKSQLFLINKY